MFKKMGMNVVILFCCVVSLLAVGAVNCPPLAGVGDGFLPLAGAQGLALDPDRGGASLSVPTADQGGVDSYTKLMLHTDGSDQGTSFTDSSSGVFNGSNATAGSEPAPNLIWGLQPCICAGIKRGVHVAAHNENINSGGKFL